MNIVELWRRGEHLLLLGGLAVLVPLSAVAQTIKPISVAQDAPYTDHVSLKADSKDMDLMVKFVFNEADNSLTVSLVSYRLLFGFRDDARYAEVVRRKKLVPEKLPYVVTADKGQQFRLGRDLLRSMEKPRKKHIFKSMMTYDGLVPVPTELRMVNDFIEQKLDIKNRQGNVTVTLREVFLMEQDPKKEQRYWIVFGKDLNTEYQVTIRRNPCYGLDDEIASTANALAAIQKSYQAFKKRYGKGKVSSQEGMQAFQELKETLVGQYPKNNGTSVCPDIQQARDEYNLLVDSISSMTVKMEGSAADAMGAIGGTEGRSLNAKSILANTRQLDSTVARWFACTDETERADLEKQCREIIKDTSVMIGGSQGQTPEERNAISLFHQAEQHFKRLCK